MALLRCRQQNFLTALNPKPSETLVQHPKCVFRGPSDKLLDLTTYDKDISYPEHPGSTLAACTYSQALGSRLYSGRQHKQTTQQCADVCTKQGTSIQMKYDERYNASS